jgi:hypothetical protein
MIALLRYETSSKSAQTHAQRLIPILGIVNPENPAQGREAVSGRWDMKKS